MVQKPIEQRRSERLIVGQSTGPLGKWQIAGEYHAAAFIAFGHDVKEQIRLLAAEG